MGNFCATSPSQDNNAGLLSVNNNDDNPIISNNYDEYRRDSFSHRVCDDLTKVLLQYLSLEEKLRLECVSKQFQRTVFQKQHELRIDFTNDLFKKIRVNSFESVLKKCPNISFIYFKENCQSIQVNHGIATIYLKTKITSDEVIDILSTNCINLTKIRIDSSFQLNDRQMCRIVNEFGPRLKTFLFFTLLPRLVNLQALRNVDKFGLFNNDFYHCKDYKFANLSKLTTHLDKSNSKDLMAFIHNNPGINSLQLALNVFDPDQTNAIILELSQIKSLIHFSLTRRMINDRSFDKSLTQMALNCTQLKSILCGIRCNSGNYYKLNELLSPLKKFKQLKCLDLEFFVESGQHIKSKGFKVSMVTDLENLTHLLLRFNDIEGKLSNDLLCNLIIKMSKLQELKVLTEIHANNKTLGILCSLNSLQYIELFINKKDITTLLKFENELAKHCPNIKVFKIIIK